jgi:methylglyoxal synthase
MKLNIALVAHDHRKQDLLDWVRWNAQLLSKHHLICTGTTGKLIEALLKELGFDNVDITKLKSGPLGGDQELGAHIVNDKVDIMIFLWDPMSSQPHDPDVKALLRMTVIYNIPTACNRSTADYLISSKLFGDKKYKRIIKDYSKYITRDV